MSVEIHRAGTLVVRARFLDDGRLTLEGHDLGGHPVFEEHEYDIRIAADQFPALRRAFGTPEDADVLALLVAHGPAIVHAGETAWLREHGVAFDLSTWGS